MELYKYSRIYQILLLSFWGDVMGRVAREESHTGYYHVMMRGNNKNMIFSNASEKLYFLEQLNLQVKERNIEVVAYCIMDNHVHLLIGSDLEDMSEAIKRINIRFARRYNNKYEKIGHVFQDRFKSEVIHNDGHLVQVMRYIHNNPVKGNMVNKAEEYTWSSYNSYINKKDRLIHSKTKDMIMEIFSGSIEEYKKFHLMDDTEEFLEIKEDLEREREERARRIISDYCKKYKVSKLEELANKRHILEEIIVEMLNKSRLPHRRIAEMTGTTRGIVNNIQKKYKIK